MKQSFIFSLLLVFISITSQAQQEKVLMRIQGDPVYASEFKAIYHKNNAVPTAEHKSIDEYVDLFVNYKLKVREAEELGLDTVKKFQDELAGYKKQLSQPYLVDTNVSEAIIKEAYERLKQEVNASHMLVKISPSATPSDTLKAYNKIMEYRKRVLKEDFKKIQGEIQKIKDPELISENLGYFTAFQMVYPFESAAFKTAPGDVSMPVRTSFGYHIVKVWDKRPSRGEVRVAHIMVKSIAKDSASMQEAAYQKAQEIHSKLKNGEPFEKLCSVFSDDKGSASKGGELPWFGPGRMVPEFEEMAFSLAQIGDLSQPVKTSYGWHIIKLLEKRTLGDFAAEKNEIKQKTQKDGRYAESRNSLIQRLKKDYGFSLETKNMKGFEAVLNNGFFDGNWTGQDMEKSSKQIFSLTDKKYASKQANYSQADFAAYLKKMSKKQDKPSDVQMYLKNAIDKFAEEKIIRFEEDLLTYKYPTYKALSKEYRDGILLFDLMDKKVWSKAIQDSIGLEKFYQENKSKYMFPDRVEAEVYSCSNKEIAEKVKKMLDKRVKNQMTSDEIIKQTNKDSQLNLSLEKNTYAKGEHPIVDKVIWKEGISELQMVNNQYYWIFVLKVIPATHKTLSEARGIITSDYQMYLEQEWIKSLRAKYAVQIDQEVLKQLK